MIKKNFLGEDVCKVYILNVLMEKSVTSSIKSFLCVRFVLYQCKSKQISVNEKKKSIILVKIFLLSLYIQESVETIPKISCFLVFPPSIFYSIANQDFFFYPNIAIAQCAGIH